MSSSTASTSAPPLSEARESARLQKLVDAKLLDTGREELFDRYVRIAATLTGTPISLVSLLDRDRQWFKAGHGLDERETPREWAFCDHAIRGNEVFEVVDATKDDRFADNPLVTGEPFIRAYAGAPILIEGEHAIGTLCVVDKTPRSLSDDQRAALADLAAVLGREIETNHLAGVREDKIAAARAAAVEIEHQMRNMFAKIGAIIEMTARETNSADELANAARRRVVALSQANEVSLRNDFAIAPLNEIAVAALIPAQNKAGVRLVVSGDAINLSPAAASIIAPLIDELANDALTRGVLTDDSAASLAWRVEPDHLTIDWREYSQGDDAPAFSGSFLQTIAPTALQGDVNTGTAGGHADDGENAVRRYLFKVPLSLVSSEPWRTS